MECFRRQELLNWSVFQASYTTVLREGVPEEPATDVFAVGTEEGDTHWKDFEKKLIEHVRGGGEKSEYARQRERRYEFFFPLQNLCVLAKYYTRISLPRLSHLLSLNEQVSTTPQ